MGKLRNIRHLNFKELQNAVKELGEPSFRANQLYEWIWAKAVTDFNLMYNLPLAFRDKLSENFIFHSAKIEDQQKSIDGTIKYLFRLYDNEVVEGVLIPSVNRETICISSQVGCPLKCTFCATAKISFKRNLFFDEIYDQVALMNKESMKINGRRISNIVYMGMGEPLLNYDNLLLSVDKITSKDGLGFSPQRITISTAGIAKMIKKIGEDLPKINLAVSLISTDDKIRNNIMPINKTYPLEKLKDSLTEYYDKTHNLITLEYVLIKGLNDSIEDIKGLKAFTKGLFVKINLIEYNSCGGSAYEKLSREGFNNFKERLEQNGYIVNIRKSKGKDIEAACGQLAGKYHNQKKINYNAEG